MSTNDKKLLTLDNIKQIKEYVDGKADTTYTNIGNQLKELDQNFKDDLRNKIGDAKNSLTTDYNDKVAKLNAAIAAVADSNSEELRKLLAQLELLKQDTNTKLNVLDDFKDVLDGVKDSVLSEYEIDELVNTALIDKTEITGDSISTQSVFAQKMVALIGRFGTVKAENIEGTEISGMTVRASSSKWELNNDGSGHLGNDGIRWDESGNVTFGKNVTITFGNVDGAEDAIDNAINKYSDEKLKEYIKDAINTNAQTAATHKDLEDTAKQLREEANQSKNEANEALSALKNELLGSINNVDTKQTELKGALERTQQEVAEYIESDFKATEAYVKEQLDAYDIAIKNAIADGNSDLADQLKRLREELAAKYAELNALYNETRTSLSILKEDVKKLSESSLNKNNISELLEAALITETQITDDMIKTPSLLAKKIVGLTGVFSFIRASKISGTTIEGYTMSSPLDLKGDNGDYIQDTEPDGTPRWEIAVDENGNPMYDENGNPIYITQWNAYTNEDEKVPVYKKIDPEDASWTLKSDGSGWVAEGQVKWDYPRKADNEINYPEGVSSYEDKKNWRKQNVTVTLGDNVSIKRVEDKLDEINNWSKDGWLSPIEQKELKATYETLINEKNQISADIKTMTDAGLTVDNVDTFNTAYSNMVKAVKKHTEGVYTWTSDTTATAKAEDNMVSVTIITSGDTRYELIPAYYEAKQKVLTSLSNAIAAKAGAAAESAAAANISDAEKNINGKLADAEERLRKAIADGDSAAIAQAEGAKTLADNASNALDTLKIALYGNKDGNKDDPSVLSSGDLYNLSLAACGAAAAKALDEGSIAADNVFAHNIVVLCGTFAEVQAEKIAGTEIKGKTIKSDEPISDTDNTPTWQLNNDGSGHLANKNISWNNKGEVTFGPDVKLSWGNVDGAPSKEELKGADGNGITSTIIKYAQSTNGTTPPDENSNVWKNSIAEVGDIQQGSYLWVWTKFIYSDNTFKNTYSVTRQGKDGTSGETVNIETALEQYKITSNTIAGKTMSSTEKVVLPEGTQYYAVDADGKLSTEKDGQEITFDKNGNPLTKLTANGTEELPAWQIGWDGTGYLAGGNVRFDKNNLTGVNVTGSFNGGNNGTLANGALTWDGNAVHVHKNFIFDEGKGISWDNVSGKPDVATKADLDKVGGVTEERVTEIAQHKISTSTITADQINTDGLSVKQLNTTGDTTTAGTIKIKDNYIDVYDKYGNGLMLISGTESYVPNEVTIIDATSKGPRNIINGNTSDSDYSVKSLIQNAGKNDYKNVVNFTDAGDCCLVKLEPVSGFTIKDNTYDKEFKYYINNSILPQINLNISAQFTYRNVNNIYTNNYHNITTTEYLQNTYRRSSWIGTGCKILVSRLTIHEIENYINAQLDDGYLELIPDTKQNGKYLTDTLSNEDEMMIDPSSSISYNVKKDDIYVVYYDEGANYEGINHCNVNEIVLSPGTYHTYLLCRFDYNSDYLCKILDWANDYRDYVGVDDSDLISGQIIFYIKGSFYSDNAIVLTPSFNKKGYMELTPNGFKYTASDTKYVEFTDKGDFKIVNNDSKFYLKDDKIYMGFTGIEPTEIKAVKQKVRTNKGYVTGIYLMVGDATYEED